MSPGKPSGSLPLLLVCGDDDYSVKQRARLAYQQWCDQVGGFDHETVDGQAANSGEALKALKRLREALQTLPFFGGTKVVWFQNCNFLGDERTAESKEVTASLVELGDELKRFTGDNLRLLISAGKVDKRKSFYKTLEKLGTVEVFAALSMEDRDWTTKAEEHLLKALRANDKQIDPQALAEMVSSVGPNLRQLQMEAEKVSLYVGSRPSVQLADVQAVVTRHKQARAFALGDALGDRDLPRLLRCLDEEMWAMQFDKDRSEIGLLYGLISKVRSLIFAQELLRENWIKPEGDFYRFKGQLERLPVEKLPADKKLSPLGLSPYVLFKAVGQARRYAPGELVRAMELLLQCNLRLVSSNLDERLVLQQTLIEIVRPPGQLAGSRAGSVTGRS